MKRILLLAALLAALLVLVACGDKPAETTPAVTTASDVTTAAPVVDTTAPATSEAPLDISVLYGTWKQVGGTATTTISEGKIVDTDGSESAPLSYTVKSQEKDANGNFVAILKVGTSEYTYTLFADKTGYGEYGYLEILTSKATLKYSK